MFSKRKETVAIGKRSDNFSELIKDTWFINKQLTKLDFVKGVMVSRSVLRGTVYIGNMQPMLDEYDDISPVLERLDIVEMLYLFSENERVEVYKRQYQSHEITQSYIRVNFTNGKSLQLSF